jgi:hypothetical protein
MIHMLHHMVVLVVMMITVVGMHTMLFHRTVVHSVMVVMHAFGHVFILSLG